MVKQFGISIHSSHTGRDGCGSGSGVIPCKFQSTLPIREETRAGSTAAPDAAISIHSSHTGRDLPCGDTRCMLRYFNPLFPYGKRPPAGAALAPAHISIHSSHTGRDTRPVLYAISGMDFNPLFPYGKRPGLRRGRAYGQSFQSTLPIREETAPRCIIMRIKTFQSTLPIREETR